MSTLPIDRTNLNLAISNQVPSAIIQSAKNINAMSTLYDGSDALYNYVLAAFAAYTAVGGAATIGTSPITGLTTANVQAMLAEIEAQVMALVAGSVPTGSITTAMIQNLAVTSAKLSADIQSKLNQIYANEREIANLKAASSIANRVDGASGTFYDLNDGLNGGSAGKIDLSKTNATSAITATGSSITVPVTGGTTGLAVGQEVTIFDDVNLERRNITALVANTSVSFAAMTNSYKAGAMICRSSVVQDTVNHLLKFNGWSVVTTNVTAVSVVAAAYDTSGNNGDKLVQTANGNFITIEVNGTTIQVQKSIDKGVSFQALCTITGAQVGAAIAWNGGNSVTVLWNTTTIVYSNTFDVTTVTNTDQNANKVTVDTQTSIVNNVSIKTGSDGIPQATWSSKNATYPNSNNIRYSKATTTAVTAWATPTQITTNNTAGTDVTNPCIVVTSNNFPHIVANTTPTTAYAILVWNWNGSTWTASAGVSIYAGGSNSQSNPCARVAPSGRIWCSWQGHDATDVTYNNIRYSYSDDGGATWLTAVKLTSGNLYQQSSPVVSIDKNNIVYIVWQGADAITPSFYNIYRNIWTGSAFQGVVKLTTNTTGHITNPASIDNNTMDFNLSTPPMIYTDAQVVAIKFSGTVGTSTPVLVEDVRYNINPPANVSSAVAWVDHDADANYSIAGAVSFQAAAGTESFASMTKTTAAIDGTHNEDQFVGSGTSAAKATLRLTLTRNSTSLVKNISQITGAVGA